jgi:hypothetical protein
MKYTINIKCKQLNNEIKEKRKCNNKQNRSMQKKGILQGNQVYFLKTTNK